MIFYILKLFFYFLSKVSNFTKFANYIGQVRLAKPSIRGALHRASEPTYTLISI